MFMEDFSKWLEGKFGRVNGGWYTHVFIQGKSDDNVRTFVKLLMEFAKDSDEYRYIFET